MSNCNCVKIVNWSDSISKSKATVAKWAVEHLAGLHYGRENDDFGICPYIKLESI